MPDGQGQYLGDYAGVIPSYDYKEYADQAINLEAARQKRLADAAAAKAASDKATSEYIGKAFDPKNVGSADVFKGLKNAEVTKAAQEATEYASKEKDPVKQNAFISNKVQQLHKYWEGTEAVQKGVQAAMTDVEKNDPGIDVAKATDLAMFDALFDKDAKGNTIPKKDINLNPDWQGSMYGKHFDKVLVNGNPFLGKALKDIYGETKYNSPDVYDIHSQKLVKKGGEHTFPNFAKLIKDEKGNHVGIEVIKAPLVVEGEQIKDAKGEPIQVVPQEMYNKLMSTPSSISMNVEKTLMERFPKIDPQSVKAEIERKKILTEQVENKLTSESKYFKDETGDNLFAIRKEDRLDKRAAMQANATASAGRGNKTDVNTVSIWDKMEEREKAQPNMQHRLDLMEKDAQKAILEDANSLENRKEDSDNEGERILTTKNTYFVKEGDAYSVYEKNTKSGKDHLLRTITKKIDIGKVNAPNAKERQAKIEELNKEESKKATEKPKGVVGKVIAKAKKVLSWGQ